MTNKLVSRLINHTALILKKLEGIQNHSNNNFISVVYKLNDLTAYIYIRPNKNSEDMWYSWNILDNIFEVTKANKINYQIGYNIEGLYFKVYV